MEINKGILKNKLYSTSHRTESFNGKEASVAFIIELEPKPHVIFIRRATREDDPWSGHMALPGGRNEDKDKDLLETAIRETKEEIGIELNYDDCLGKLNPHSPRMGRSMFRIHPFYFIEQKLNRFNIDPLEVAQVHKIPLKNLVDLSFYDWRSFSFRSTSNVQLPSFKLDDIEIWGVTYVFLMDFLSLLSSIHESHFQNEKWEKYLSAFPYKEHLK